MALQTFVILSLLPSILANPVRRSAPKVTISLPKATIVGQWGPRVERFNGIPFARPPTGNLRLRPPEPIQYPLGTVAATEQAQSCPQMASSINKDKLPASVIESLGKISLMQKVSNTKEDCLTLDIYRPAGTTAKDKLPVLVWVYGGGFESGSTSMYDGGIIVSDAMFMDMPMMFVAMNYRVGGFGFMPGSEVLVDGAANLGLLDQRLALEWVADNIVAFGGDPSKVTIWGQSAGSISVLNQMLLYDGDTNYKGSPLFRGAIMNSGSIVPADPIDGIKGQAVYDAVVAAGGCSSHEDTLSCLRGLDYDDFANATNSVPGISSYNSVALSYLPRPDGKIMTQSPDKLIKAGKYASVPFIIGDQEDEGTLFALSQFNLTTTEDLFQYFKTLFLYDATDDQIGELVATYQTITIDGSPFRTGIFNNWYPQFKRLAAILGDLAFTLTRRAFLKYASEVNPDVPSWSYLASYNYGTPIMGTFHGSDIPQVFYGMPPNYASRSIHSYYFSFVHDLDPNTHADGYMNWPQWSDGQMLMHFFAHHAELLKDDFRSDTYQFLLENVDSLHI